MHLVFVSSLIPAGSPESGYDIANQAIIDGLRRTGARVTVLGFRLPGTPPPNGPDTICLGEVDVRTDSASAIRKLRWLATAMTGGLTFSSAKLRVVSDATVQTTLHGLEPCDGLILNSVQLAGAFEHAFTAMPYVFVAHNVEHLSAAENASEASGLFERFMFTREARYLKSLEERLTRGARFVLTLSEEDRRSLGVPASRSAALPLVTPHHSPVKGPRVPAFDIGLLGTWTWAPNRIGLEWFLQNVVPKLHPDVTVAVAGKTPRGFPARDKRVAFLGCVNDAKEFLRQCRVVALTARAGTGVQLKSIETFELGLPAVATTSSLRGIAADPPNLRRADDPDAFAEALHELILGQRTGTVPDVDGADFRASQTARMDKILKDALQSIVEKRKR